MNRFDVLSRNCLVNDHTLIEASAGTGKTFSMAHLFVRLLLEKNEACVREILVVTFTRKATAEIKERIRDLLEELEEELSKKIVPFDYVKEFVENHGLEEALQRVKKALNSWDEAQVFTIHALAERLVKMEQSANSELLEDRQQRHVVHDFLTQNIDPEELSRAQLGRVLKSHRYSIETLKSALVSGANSSSRLSGQRSYIDLYQEFSQFKWPSFCLDELKRDFQLMRPNYKQGPYKALELELVESFNSYLEKCESSPDFFEFMIEYGVILTELFSLENRKVKFTSVQIKSNSLLEWLDEVVTPLVNIARDPGRILIKLIDKVRSVLNAYKKSRRRHTHDDNIFILSKLLSDDEILNSIRNSYKAALIDEFQDTDPLQWSIFKKLFIDDPEKRCRLFLVGDPKQAIYAFRQSDIYTYFEAAKALGPERSFTLDTNWRSQKRLVECLNHLFDAKAFPELITLPRINSFLTVPRVFSGDDTTGNVAVHFFQRESTKKITRTPIDEEEILVRRVCSEIIKTFEEGAKLNSWAILVRSTDQAARIELILKEYSIPVDCQKRASLNSVEGFLAVKHLISIFSDKTSFSSVSALLGSRFLRWKLTDIQSLKDSEKLFEVCCVFEELKKQFEGENFGQFFERFILSSFISVKPIYNLQFDEDFYAQVRQTVDLVAEKQQSESLSSNLLHKCILDIENNSEIKVQQTAIDDAVKMVTLHSSKGLEYDYVFPIGLICSFSRREALISSGNLLISKNEDEKAYQQYLEESDSEQMRLLYVAFTRAKKKLYVPLITSEKGEDLSPGKGSPIGLYLSKYKGVGSFKLFVQKEGFEWEDIGKSSQINQILVKSKKNNVMRPVPVSMPEDFLELHSFTSMTKNLEVDYPQFVSNENKNAHTLPPGKLTGIILHKLLEHANFSNLSDSHLKMLMKKYVSKTALEGWESVLIEMLQDVSKTSLDGPAETFTLSDIELRNIRAEEDFLFKEHEESYVHGSIDFFCKHHGKYYIIDWKSNWLGENSSYYKKPNLAKQMEDHRYTLQAELYKKALKKYLAFFEEKPFEEVYGGAFYIFIRGVGVHYEK